MARALHCTALHCTALHCTALHCTALQCTALHCTALHCTALHCTALQDADKLVMGYILVFIYVNLMLSKMNCVEQRIWLSVIGILRQELINKLII
jgi:hypothetical protein